MSKSLRYLTPLLICIALAVGGCTGSGQQVEPQNALVLTAEELDRSGDGTDVYSLLMRVRPRWLQKNGPHSITGGDDIRVYVNGMRFDNPTSLRFYHTADVESIRFLTPGRATVRFGIGHSHGAIVVELVGGGIAVP
jgi:hypothetical protein